MFWSKKKEDKYAQFEVVSKLQEVPDGFFKCGSCSKVFSVTKYGHSLWKGEKVSYICKDCFENDGPKPVVVDKAKAEALKRYSFRGRGSDRFF